MDVNEFIYNVRKSATIEIDNKQAGLILENVLDNGYMLEFNGDDFVIKWTDQLGDMEKKVLPDDLIIFAMNQKYKSTCKMMDSLDEIKAININNVRDFCAKLENLIIEESELHQLEKAFTQTAHYKDIKKSIEKIPEKSKSR